MGLYRSAWNVLQIFNMFGQSMAVNGVLAPRLQNHKGCICIAFHDHPNANTITNTIYTYIYKYMIHIYIYKYDEYNYI